MSPASPYTCSLRHFAHLDGLRTTIRLENDWWAAIDRIAQERGGSWREWAAQAIEAKPEGAGVAGWLRVCVLRAVQARGQIQQERSA